MTVFCAFDFLYFKNSNVKIFLEAVIFRYLSSVDSEIINVADDDEIS